MRTYAACLLVFRVFDAFGRIRLVIERIGSFLVGVALFPRRIGVFAKFVRIGHR